MKALKGFKRPALNRSTLSADLTAGLTFALVNIPQSMAHAAIATVNPVYGLYTLMVAMPVGALFAGAIYMNISTTSALAVATADALAPYAGESRATALVTLVLLIGVFQLVLGILRLGFLVRFVSFAVMTGFMTGVAVLIVLGQLGDFTGYYSSFDNKIVQLADLILNLQKIDTWTITIGLLTVGLIYGFRQTRWRSLAFVLALVSTSILTALLNYVLGLGIQIVADIAEVPRSLPEFTLPDWKLIFGLVIPAAAIGIIGLVQGAGVSQTFPNPDGKFSDTSRDFLGQGLANIAGAFFRGIPAGGSSSGTAVVVGAGAKSRLANVFAGIAVAIGVLLFADLVEQVALSALAALVIVAGFEMVNRRAIHSVWQTNWVARILMLITFGGTLVMPLQYAVFLGVALSILLFVAQQSNTVRIVEWVLEERRLPLERPAPKTLESHRWTLIHIYGSLFYAAAGAFEESLPDASGTQRAVVILRLRGRDEMGSTVIEVFRRYAKALQDNDGKLILAGVSAPLRSQLERTSLAALIGREWIFDSTDQLGESVNAAIEAAQRWLGQPAPSSSATDSALLTSQD